MPLLNGAHLFASEEVCCAHHGHPEITLARYMHAPARSSSSLSSGRFLKNFVRTGPSAFSRVETRPDSARGVEPRGCRGGGTPGSAKSNSALTKVVSGRRVPRALLFLARHEKKIRPTNLFRSEERASSNSRRDFCLADNNTIIFFILFSSRPRFANCERRTGVRSNSFLRQKAPVVPRGFR